MRKVLLVFIAVGLAVSGFAQKSADIGVWGGSSTYFGDIKPAAPLESFNLNLGAYFRYNFNPRVGLRMQFLTGSFASSGYIEDVEVDFSKNAQDVSAMMEINFLKYVLGDKKTPFTPYILGGIGVMYFPYTSKPDLMEEINIRYPVTGEVKESVVAATVPFGFGIKFSIGARLGIGAEYQMRKLFSDKLDDFDDPLSFVVENENGNGNNTPGTGDDIVPGAVNNNEVIKYTTLWHNNDWPGYLGVHLTYKLYLNKRECPAYDRKYW